MIYETVDGSPGGSTLQTMSIVHFEADFTAYELLNSRDATFDSKQIGDVDFS